MTEKSECRKLIRRLSVLLMSGVLLGLCALLTPNASADEAANFAGGAGVENDPYLIATARQLDSVRHHLAAHFRLTADIDLEGYTENPEGWEPIGHFRGWLDFEPFTGTFDGGGHKIINLTLNRPESDHTGLFGYLDDNASLKNVELVSVSIIGGSGTGALAGYVSSGSVTGSSAGGTVQGRREVGGLIGNNLGNIANSHAQVDVTSGDMSAGGLAGNNAGTITGSYALGNVAGGGDNTGGLVGINAGDITDCYAAGNVTGERSMTGGLVGSNSGAIRESYAEGNVTGKGEDTGGLIGATTTGAITGCYATGSVEGETYVGGLVGRALFTDTITASHALGNVTGRRSVGGLVGRAQGIVITRCYAAGDVTGEDYVGGLVGENTRAVTWRRNAAITNSYALGDVTGRSRVGGLAGFADEYADSLSIENTYAVGKVTGENLVGGLVGQLRRDNIVNSYFDMDTTGRNDTNGTPKPTAEMMLSETFEGWDFEDIWTITEGESYPVLRVQEDREN